MSFRATVRGVAIGACTALLVTSPCLLAIPAQAAPAAHATAAFRVASSAAQRVDAFFGQYRDAVLGQNPDQNPREVEEEFLSVVCITELDLYARTHDADPVFRAQNVPDSWSVADAGAGALGYTKVLLTQHWGDGSTTKVMYTVRNSNLVITNLKTVAS